MTNEELFYLLQKFYPGTNNGTHYLTGHRLDTEGAQFGEAFLQYWKLPTPQPSPRQLRRWWNEHGEEIRAVVEGVHQRWVRNDRLLEADAMVYKAEDAGDTARLAAARKYRQALRDVPQLPGFPWSFAWPESPEAQRSVMPSVSDPGQVEPATDDDQIKEPESIAPPWPEIVLTPPPEPPDPDNQPTPPEPPNMVIDPPDVPDISEPLPFVPSPPPIDANPAGETPPSTTTDQTPPQAIPKS